MAYEVPPEPPDGALALVRSLAQGVPLLRLYRHQGPIWLRDGNGAYAVWEHLVEWDENHAPVVVVTQGEVDAAICWDTTCLSCAATLTALRAQEERAEKAKELLADARAYLTAHRAINEHDHLDEGLSCTACELLERIEAAT